MPQGERTSDYDYPLPPERIAQHPVEPRDAARLMVLRRREGTIEHHQVSDLPELLAPGDLVVVNDTRVFPARVYGHKERGGGRVEVLFLEEEGGDWDVLLRARRRPKIGDRIVLPDGVMAVLVAEGERGRARLRLSLAESFFDWIERVGLPPLPPYIQREAGRDPRLATDRERYQTIYARSPGSVAAPTAGLHFTPHLFERLAARGVECVPITLHVGIGTFRPVTVERPEAHRMDAERYVVSPEAAERIRTVRSRGGRIVAVGTTTVRTLETVADEHGMVHAAEGRTELFIRPPYRFKVVDALMTNFHLPRSTLLMLVSAFAGRERVLAAYEEAVRTGYRFYSYGDAMLIL